MTTRRASPRGRYRQRRSSPRTEWTSATLDQRQLLAGAEDVLDLLGGLTVAEKQRVGTILRIVGNIYIHNEAVNVQVFGRWGIHLVTDDGLAGLAVPDPTTDLGAAWMWNDHYYVDSSTVGLEPYRREVDIRAKRRIPGESTLAYVMENSGAGDLRYAIGFRLLYSVK